MLEAITLQLNNAEYIVSDTIVECLLNVENIIYKGTSQVETRTNVYGYNIPDIVSAKDKAFQNAIEQLNGN